MFKRIFLLLMAGFAMTSVFAAYTDIKVTEIMYNAPGNGITPGSAYEFIELKNTGSTTVNLSGFNFSIGIQWAAPTGFSIAPGAFAVLVSNPVEFAVKYPSVTISGTYTGSLSNGGEWLKASVGIDTFIAFKFNDNSPWPVLADGNGFSLVPVDINPIGSQNKASLWRNSTNIGGSPGADDPAPPVYPDVIVNEIMTNPVLPGVDSIEIFNHAASAVDISNWWLTDNKNIPEKYKIPNGTIIAAGGYKVFDENQFGIGLNGFGLSSSGEMVFLFSADAGANLSGYSSGWNFDGQYKNKAFGVYTNSTGKRLFVAMTHSTMGRPNAIPDVGPIVINKINYFPDLNHYEFLCLKNIGDTLVNLHSTAFPDSTWEVSGIGFAFPPGVSMAPGESIYLTKALPSQFRSKYNVSANIKVYQYFGSLNNKGESITLYAIGNLYTKATGSFMSRILIDKVKYNNKLPWPVSAAGAGDYLKRNVDTDFGNDVANWSAANGSIVQLIKPLALSPISVRPLPVHDQVLFSGFKGMASLSIFNLQGSRIEVLQLDANETVNLGNLASGAYFYQLQTGEGIYNGKLIKE